MPTIEPYISKYIDSSIDRAVKIAGKEFSKRNKAYLEESKRHMSSLVEQIDERVEEIQKVAASLPSEERVREIFQEEIKPFATESKIFRQEIIALRLKSDNHERRITKLETLQLA